MGGLVVIDQDQAGQRQQFAIAAGDPLQDLARAVPAHLQRQLRAFFGGHLRVEQGVLFHIPKQ